MAAALSVQPAGSHTGRLGGVRPGGGERGYTRPLN